MADLTFETEMWIELKDGVPQAPKVLECPNCGTDMRRRPGHVYRCSECGGFTTLDLTNALPIRKDIKV